MAWYTPDPANFESIGLTSVEFSVITSTLLPDGESGSAMLAKKIVETVNHIRLYAGLPGRTLGVDGTIPSELSMEFTAILRRLVYERMPGTVSAKLFGDDRRQAALRADETLARVSKVTTGIVDPISEAPADEQPAGPAVDLVDLCDHGWGNYH